jgi:DNA-binding response OmpR family regulator
VPRILIVEDDENFARGLEINLTREGFDVVRARRGETALDMAARTQPDLITLDVMLPGMSGIEVVRELRHRGIATPVIMLTARADEVDKVLGLEIGADDYLTKPFGLPELIARIHARLRRDAGTAKAATGHVVFGDVDVDLERFAATRNGRPIDLTTKEFDILRLLIRNRGQVVSRDRLLDEVWGGDVSVSPRSVDMHVMNLRRKVEPDPSRPVHVLSAYGEGYRFAG